MTNVPARRGTAFLVWSADLQQPERCATLFMTAQACCAFDLQVELYFTGASVRLLLQDSQSNTIGYGDDARALSHHLAQTQHAGARLLACSQALQGLKVAKTALIAGVDSGGVVQFAARCADPQWNTLVF